MMQKSTQGIFFLIFLFCLGTSCKQRTTSQIANAGSLQLPVMSLEVSGETLDLLGHFPYNLTQKIHESINKIRTSLSGVSVTYAKTGITPFPNVNQLQFNLDTKIWNHTNLNVVQDTLLSKLTNQQLNLLRSNTQTYVQAITAMYFDKSGIGVDYPVPVDGFLKTAVQASNLPGKRFVETSFRQRTPEIETQIKTLIWDMYILELQNTFEPIIQEVNRNWNIVKNELFYDQNRLQVAEDIDFETSTNNFKVVLTDRRQLFNEPVSPPQEIPSNKPSVQLNVHPNMVTNFARRYIESRKFYSINHLSELLRKLPFMSLVEESSVATGENTQQQFTTENQSGVEFTGPRPIYMQVFADRIEFVVRGIFYYLKDNEQRKTHEMLVTIPYKITQTEVLGRYYTSVKRDQLTTYAIPDGTEEPTAFKQVSKKFVESIERIAVQTQLVKAFPDSLLPYEIVVSDAKKTVDIGGGIIKKVGDALYLNVAQVNNGWLQALWAFEQDTILQD